MKRIIKFRAWNKISKVWVKPEHLNNPKNMRIELTEEGFRFLNGKESAFEFVQFTGLKDKNGKEIYEGDLVNVLYKNGEILGQILIEFGCFTLGKNDWGVEYKTMGFSGKWEDGGSTHCGLNKDEIFEIVGNIFENPKLWKGKKK